jgi:glycosyltransferase involved in cell wall biosynthesis
MKWLAEFALSDLVLMLSEDMCRRWVRMLGIQRLPGQIRSRLRNKLNYVYSIVDPNRFRPIPEERREVIRNELGLHGSPLLTYVGSFTPKKNQISLIREVLPQLVRQHPDLKVAFVGDFDPSENAYADSCRRAVEELGLSDNVFFAGYRDDIERWYQTADMTLLASSKEGLARSMIESLACGTPVVSFNVASAKEILEEHNCGVVVPQGHYAQFVDAIFELWENDCSRQEMGERGVDVARKLFDPETIIQQYRAIYEGVAAEI